MSFARRLRRHPSSAPERRQQVRNAKRRDRQRADLRARLLEAAGERDPYKFLAFIRDQRRGYDRSFDGPSPLMDLVDEIDALAREEGVL